MDDGTFINMHDTFVHLNREMNNNSETAVLSYVPMLYVLSLISRLKNIPHGKRAYMRVI